MSLHLGRRTARNRGTRRSEPHPGAASVQRSSWLRSRNEPSGRARPRSRRPARSRRSNSRATVSGSVSALTRPGRTGAPSASPGPGSRCRPCRCRDGSRARSAGDRRSAAACAGGTGGSSAPSSPTWALPAGTPPATARGDAAWPRTHSTVRSSGNGCWRFMVAQRSISWLIRRRSARSGPSWPVMARSNRPTARSNPRRRAMSSSRLKRGSLHRSENHLLSPALFRTATGVDAEVAHDLGDHAGPAPTDAADHHRAERRVDLGRLGTAGEECHHRRSGSASASRRRAASASSRGYHRRTSVHAGPGLGPDAGRRLTVGQHVHFGPAPGVDGVEGALAPGEPAEARRIVQPGARAAGPAHQLELGPRPLPRRGIGSGGSRSRPRARRAVPTRRPCGRRRCSGRTGRGGRTVVAGASSGPRVHGGWFAGSNG